MRMGRVIAAGLCFLAVAAPNISTAQSQKAKAAKAVVGVITPRVKYYAGEGWKADPPYKIGNFVVIEKIPTAWIASSGEWIFHRGKWIAGSGGISAAGTASASWWCRWQWCVRQPGGTKGWDGDKWRGNP
jgi:hypothetical protein